ncbi:MAG: polysulfide reductase NrfD [Chloroflexi bacterium]|nr:polysulfide reductase NrfD [Chloroflexota bacterium]
MHEYRERGPYGRSSNRQSERRAEEAARQGTPLEGRTNGRHNGAHRTDGYDGPTYYNRPVVKESVYGWLVATYLWTGGIAGAAQVLATIADLAGGKHDRATVRAGRYTALTGAMLGPIFLIADLHTPSRWYNMLRIFRPTSPMSIGSWTLFTFGMLSGLTAVGQAADDVLGATAGRRLARCFGIPASVAGALMTIYTGTLLGGTSTPLWGTASRSLSALFGATSFSTGTAALMLVLRACGAPAGAVRRLRWIGMASGVAQIVLSLVVERDWRRRGISGPVDEMPLGIVYRGGAMGGGMLVPLALNAAETALGGRPGLLATFASLGALGGGFAERVTLVFGGNRSARRPTDYLRVTQPDGAAGPAHEYGVAGTSTPAAEATR